MLEIKRRIHCLKGLKQSKCVYRCMPFLYSVVVIAQNPEIWVRSMCGLKRWYFDSIRRRRGVIDCQLVESNPSAWLSCQCSDNMYDYRKPLYLSLCSPYTITRVYVFTPWYHIVLGKHPWVLAAQGPTLRVSMKEVL